MRAIGHSADTYARAIATSQPLVDTLPQKTSSLLTTMYQQPPIPENEDYLFLDYIRGCNNIALAHTHKLTLDQFTAWANSGDTRTRVEAFAKATKLQAKVLLASTQLDIINALLKMALAPPPQTDDPKVIAAAEETARKAASLLFRAAQKQSLGDDASQSEEPDDPDNDPDDDPETDPDGDSTFPTLKGSSSIAECPPSDGRSVDGDSQSDTDGGGKGRPLTLSHPRNNPRRRPSAVSPGRAMCAARI